MDSAVLRRRLARERLLESVADSERQQAESPTVVALLDAGPRQSVFRHLRRGITLVLLQPLLFAALRVCVPRLGERGGEQGVRRGVVIVLAHGFLEILSRFLVPFQVPQTGA